MTGARVRLNEAQKNIESVHQPRPEFGRQNWLAQVKSGAPQVIYRPKISGNQGTPADLLTLQHSLGNRAVQRMLARRIGETFSQQQAVFVEISRRSIDVLQQTRNEVSVCMQADKKTAADELSRSIVARQQPLNLVFYDSEAAEATFFRHQATMIAEAIGAVRMPAVCPKDKTALKLAGGATGFTDEDILPGLKKAVTCTGRRISEFHVVGHTHDGVEFGKAAQYSALIEPGVRVIFHGCSVLSYKEGLEKLLKAFGSEAEIFAHPVADEAGRPYEFRRVTLPDENEKLRIELLKRVTVILPRTYIMKWASEQKSSRLYALLAREKAEVQDDAKETFIEVLKQRLTRNVENWNESLLLKKIEKTRFEWEREIVLGEFSKRMGLREIVQFQSTDTIRNMLKTFELGSGQRKIVEEELKVRQRFEGMVKKWNRKKLELNRATPIKWAQETIERELSARP